MIAESKKACSAPIQVSCRLTTQASVTPIEIGTSMLVRPALSALKAERKNGWPAKATAGTAMTADSQWNRVRVASPIEPSWPDHMATDSSMTLAAAKAGDRETAQQLARLAVLLCARRHRLPRCDAEAQRRDQARMIVGLGSPCRAT